VPWHQDRIIAVARKTQVPGSHNWSHQAGVWHCEPPGEVLQRMLTLHQSRTFQRHVARRVLRVDYATGGLPGGLQWQMKT